MVSFRFDYVSRKRAQLTNSPQMCSDWFLLFLCLSSPLAGFFFPLSLAYAEMPGIALPNEVCMKMMLEKKVKL